MRDENPFEAPKSMSGAVGVLSGSREDLRGVARDQKGILVCILIYFVAVFGQFALPPNLRPVLGILVVCLGLVGAVFVFSLAIKVYRMGLGVVLGILSLIPHVGLFVLLRVNARATSTLKQNGISVGLLGADVGSI